MKDLAAEIGLVRARQTRLFEEVGLLDARIALLERTVAAPVPAVPSASVAPRPALTPQPPPLPDETPVVHSVPELVRVPSPEVRTEPAPADSDGAEAENLEIRFGTVWAVRLGIFIFLTGLVFLGGYTYENYVSQWGPFPRALILYAISGGLIAGGWLLERRAGMENFARVVLAGGLAATFFTTWASHYLEPLRWIESATVAAVLLLGWTAAMGWLADRRRSQLLAGFSLLLAYYTCVITPVASFSLVAMLLLSMAAVFFLIRHGWTALALGALPATYGAFAFWQFLYPVVTGQQLALDSGTGLGFLCCYWTVFTAAIFTARRGAWPEGVGAAWAGLNNVAVFTLGTAVLAAAGSAHLWSWSVGLGAACLALAYAAERWRDNFPAVSRIYLATGLLFVTIGLFQHWSGFSLALLLAVKSLILLLVSHRHWRPWYLAGSIVTSALAMIMGIVALVGGDHPAAWAAGAVAAVQLGAGWLEQRRTPSGTTSFVFAGFGLLTTLALIMETASPAAQCWWLAGLAVLAIPGFSFHRYWALNLGAHLWLGMAVLLALFGYGTDRFGSDTLIGVALVSVAIAQWWQRSASVALSGETRLWIQLPFALVEASAIFLLLESEIDGPWRNLIAVAVAFGLVGKAAAIGSVWSAGVALVVGMVAALALIFDLLTAADARWLHLGTIVAMAGLAGAMNAYGRLSGSAPTESDEAIRHGCARSGTLLLAHASLGAALFWVFRYESLPNATWTVALMGLALVAAGRLRPGLQTAGLAGGAVLALAVAAFCWQLPSHGGLAASAVIVPLVLLGTRRILSTDHPARPFLLVTGLGLLWWYSTDRLIDLGGGFALTIGWGVLATMIFALGLSVRDRGYRIGGLAIFAAALVRLIFFDLWQLGTLTRVLSCMVLGLLLVGIGFVYNRYSERMKRYL